MTCAGHRRRRNATRMARRPRSSASPGRRFIRSGGSTSAVFDASFVTREVCEDTMCCLADAGFTRDTRFQLREGGIRLAVRRGGPAAA